MKYKSSCYKDFSAFIAEAVEIAKDRIGLYNNVVDPLVTQRLKNKGFLSFLDSLLWLIRNGGWNLLITVAALVALGSVAFTTEIAILAVICPILMVLQVIFGGYVVYRLWENRDVILATKHVGDNYISPYHNILDQYKSLDDRFAPVNKLMKDCVKSICVEVFGANNAAFLEKLDKLDAEDGNA